MTSQLIDFKEFIKKPWASQCGLKKAWGSLADANARALEVKDGLVAYNCPHCGLFHIGHKIPRKGNLDD